MDIYDYLKMDHQKVSHLFKQFKNSDSAKRKKEIIAMLLEELLIHLKAEQDIFYPVLEEHASSRQEAFHGREEHNEIENQINRLLNDKKTDKNWEEKVFKLKDLVDHHVKEEEGDIFNEAKKVISDDEACVLKEKVHYRKLKYKLDFEKSTVET
jgi:hemerythrin superfamily protein